MGFKKTSDTIAISFGLTEAAPNTFIEEQVALQLDVLNNEIFVVLAADLNLTPPDAVPATDTNTFGAISNTSVASMPTLANTNTIAVARDAIRAAGFVDSGVGFTRSASETYTGDVEYIALISTNNFFVQLQGQGNTLAKSVNGRVWGYRARADAATYAALVQSEVLSA
jgi:hypothetical protein|tara:strand:+ start:482 stop:988 length:507 start_codon:yes stop_codon:yes gene_type:complete